MNERYGGSHRPKRLIAFFRLPHSGLIQSTLIMLKMRLENNFFRLFHQ